MSQLNICLQNEKYWLNIVFKKIIFVSNIVLDISTALFMFLTKFIFVGSLFPFFVLRSLMEIPGIVYKSKDLKIVWKTENDVKSNINKSQIHES